MRAAAPPISDLGSVRGGRVDVVVVDDVVVGAAVVEVEVVVVGSIDSCVLEREGIVVVVLVVLV